MDALNHCSFSPPINYLSNAKLKPLRPINSFLCPHFFKPISPSNTNPTLSLPSFCGRLRVCQTKARSPKRLCRLLVVSESVDGNSETNPEAKTSDSSECATVDLKLPRRSLLVQFTCDECGERTQRRINRLAYEQGLVYVQCAGCEQYHKLADNLGLVTEFDLREESSAESSTDQV